MRRDIFKLVMGLWVLWRFVYAAEAPYGSATYWETVWTYPTHVACASSYLGRDAGVQRGDQDGAVQVSGTWLKIQEKRYQCVESSRIPMLPMNGGTIDNMRVYSEDQDMGVVKFRPRDR
jgi:hypothetical protein